MIDEMILEDDLEEYTIDDPLAPFLADGTITEVLGEIKSGKEGTVYCCRANPDTGMDLVAAKVYRPRSKRSFKNDSVYREGRTILNKRNARAVKKRTDWGRDVAFGMWIDHEFSTLTTLSNAGADVPRPLTRSSNVILMEFIGDEDGAASAVAQVDLDRAEARLLFDRVLANIELFLSHDFVHGDLSAYNILYRPGGITVIDFPQAVDPRSNEHASELLQRDVDNVYRYWSRYGIKADPSRFSQYLWRRYRYSDL